MTDTIETTVAVEEPATQATEKRSKTGRRILAIILVILVLLLIAVGFYLVRILIPTGAPSGELGNVSWVRSIYGFGDTDAELTNPAAVALDPSDGTIWMADPSKFRLVHYGTDGSFLGVIQPSRDASGTDEAQTEGLRFRLPSEIAMDNDGLIYVLEPTYDIVRVFETDGTEIGDFSIPEPLSIAVNDDYIVVGTAAGFAVLDKFGNPLQVIGTAGEGEGQFDKVNGVAIDEDNTIYVADTFNNRISSWTVEGEQLWLVQTGYPGNQQMTGETEFKSDAPAQMQLPMGLTLDNNNRLIVADMFDFSIAAFDKETGEFLAKFGEIALKMEDGKFFYPSDVDYDPLHDWFVVSDTGAKRAQIITLPDSGGSLLAKGRNSFSGPLKACLFPFLLLLAVVVISFIVNRINRKKRADARRAALAAATSGPESAQAETALR